MGKREKEMKTHLLLVGHREPQRKARVLEYKSLVVRVVFWRAVRYACIRRALPEGRATLQKHNALSPNEHRSDWEKRPGRDSLANARPVEGPILWYSSLMTGAVPAAYSSVPLLKLQFAAGKERKRSPSQLSLGERFTQTGRARALSRRTRRSG
jgi:hypothetical protein